MQSNSIELIQWLLTALHQGLNGTKATNSSIIYKTFRGKMRVYTRKVLPVDMEESEKFRLLGTEEYMGAEFAMKKAEGGRLIAEKEEEQPFMFLTVDLPPPPVHRDELLANIIPQVSND